VQTLAGLHEGDLEARLGDVQLLEGVELRLVRWVPVMYDSYAGLWREARGEVWCFVK
jgi:hypothetical protein